MDSTRREEEARRGVGTLSQRLSLFLLVILSSTTAPSAAGGDWAEQQTSDEEPSVFVVSRVQGPALLDAVRGSSFCPAGWEDRGTFDLTAYVLANETEFSEGPLVEKPCGLNQDFFEAFLYGDGVRMQGSGRARDGSIVRYRRDGCFERAECPLTASGRCAATGRTIAVDPSVIPLGSQVLIEGLGERRAEDTGGAIRGHHIDVYYGEDLTYRQAMSMTRHDRRVCVRSTES